MSDLGYQNKAQSQLKLCYNDLDTFLGRLFDAVTQPWPDYQKIGTHRDGQWIQLNTNVLQIENEYYSSIRPKRATGRCERRSPRWPSAACSTWKCAAWTSTPTRRSASRPRPAASSMPSCCSAPRPTALLPRQRLLPAQRRQLLHRRQEGRKPGLQLDREGQPVSLAQWGNELLDRIAPYAALTRRWAATPARAGRPARQARRSRCHALGAPAARTGRRRRLVPRLLAGPEPQARRDAARAAAPPRRPPPMSRPRATRPPSRSASSRPTRRISTPMSPVTTPRSRRRANKAYRWGFGPRRGDARRRAGRSSHQEVLLMRRIATALLALAASMASVAHAAPPPMQTVESVDLKRYAGMWYEIANFPMVFQRNCVGDTTAEYTLHPDGSVGVQPLPQQGRRGRFRVRHGHRGRRQQQRQAGSHVPAPSRATTGSSAWTRNTAGPWSARPTASTCGSCRARPSCRRKLDRALAAAKAQGYQLDELRYTPQK